jgi:GDPmannose 4,6-dehydratase
MKKAFITGILGQDGIHLTDFLLSIDYEVHGLINGQRNSSLNSFLSRFPTVQLHSGDLTDFSSLVRLIDLINPDEVYNLAAISFVGMSFSQPELTANVTGVGALRVFEAVRTVDKVNRIRVYQASSSEMFGKVTQVPQNEATRFHPRSPYGVAKVFAHYAAQNYREAYGMFISSGILFNHEGENRGHEFVTRKITRNVARIKLGKQKNFSLGSLEPKRDWGYAGDYVRAMWKMLQIEVPDDFVIATGKAHSVREFTECALISAGLEPKVEKYVTLDSAFIRPAEVDLLIGDPSKANSVLDWRPTKTFAELVELMVTNDLKLESLTKE